MIITKYAFIFNNNCLDLDWKKTNNNKKLENPAEGRGEMIITKSALKNIYNFIQCSFTLAEEKKEKKNQENPAESQEVR